MESAMDLYLEVKPLESQTFSSGPTLAGMREFQLVVADLEIMESEGLIQLTTKHQEKQTGQRMIDLVKFVRLK